MKVIVVGSGIIGLSIAFELALANHSVRVITRNYEEGASWIAGGMLAPFSEGLKGEELELSIDSLNLYPEFIKRIEEVSHVKVFFNTEGILRLATDEEELKFVEEKIKEYKGKGFEIQELTEKDIRDLGLSERVLKAYLFKNEGNVDSEKLMDALLFACENLGIRIVMDEIVDTVLENGEVKEVVGLKERYTADFYVFTLGAWSRMLFNLPVYPIKGQILKIKGPEPKYVYYSKLAYIIPKEAYLLIGATVEDAGFDIRPTLEGIKRLSEGAMKVLPELKDAEFLGVKVGFRPATPDLKPIYELGKNYIISTGHYRNGILWAPISAKIVLDYIERGVKSRYFEVFDLKRFK